MSGVSNEAMFPQDVVKATAVVTAANTDIDDAPDANIAELNGSGGLPADIENEGGEIVRLWAIPRATATATVLYLYESNDNGTTKRVALAELAAADTVSTTDAPAPINFKLGGDMISPSNPYPIQKGSGGSKTRVYGGASVALAAGWVFHALIRRYTKAPPA